MFEAQVNGIHKRDGVPIERKIFWARISTKDLPVRMRLAAEGVSEMEKPRIQ